MSVTCKTPTYPNTALHLDHPPTPGTVLEVKCTAGHENTGSETITCEEGGAWSWEVQPSCQSGEITLFNDQAVLCNMMCYCFFDRKLNNEAIFSSRVGADLIEPKRLPL